MKRKLLVILFIFSSFLLTGCKKDQDNNVQMKVKMIIPAGGPALGLAQLMHDVNTIDNYKIEYEVVSGPDMLVSAIQSGTHEIVIAPTNVGAKLYNAGFTYQYAATITQGSLFLVSRNDITINDLENETILAFGQNSTPDILLRKLLEYNNILDKVNIEYLPSVADVNYQYAQNNYDHVLLAEPSLSVMKTKSDVYTVLDLQSEYKEMTGHDSYPQAGIFIEENFLNENQEFVQAFLDKVYVSTRFANALEDLAASYYIDLEIMPTFPKDVLIDSIPNSNLTFINSVDSKPLVEEYLNMIYEFNPTAIGGKLPDDSFYVDLTHE